MMVARRVVQSDEKMADSWVGSKGIDCLVGLWEQRLEVKLAG